MFGRFALEGTFLEDHVALLLLGVCRKTRDEPVCSLRLKEGWALLAIGGLAPKSQAALVHQALAARWTPEALNAALDTQAAKRLP